MPANTAHVHPFRQIPQVASLLLFIFVMEHWVSAAAFNIDMSHLISEHCIEYQHRAINKDHPVLNFVCAKSRFADIDFFSKGLASFS